MKKLLLKYIQCNYSNIESYRLIHGLNTDPVIKNVCLAVQELYYIMICNSDSEVAKVKNLGFRKLTSQKPYYLLELLKIAVIFIFCPFGYQCFLSDIEEPVVVKISNQIWVGTQSESLSG